MTDPIQEQQKADERQALSAKAVHQALLQEGQDEIARSPAGLFWSAVAAGISMGLSLIAQGALLHYLPDTSWRPLVVSLGYSVGFIAVILGRQQLFTETTLTALLPFLHDHRASVLRLVLRMWAVVFTGNILGAFVFAGAAFWTTAFSDDLLRAFLTIGSHGADYSFATAFVKGIFGGWMLALMVWLMPSVQDARIFVIGIIAWCLAAGGMAHIVAGSLNVMFAVFSGAVTWPQFLLGFMVPVLLGNSVGGIVFVAAINHAQVVQGEPG